MSDATGWQRTSASLSPRILVGLIVAGMAATTNAQVFALLLSPVATDLGLSVPQLGGLRAIEEVVAVATGLAITPVIDRYPRRGLLMVGFAFMAIAASVAIVSVHPAMMVGYFVIDGVSKILIFSAVLALPGDLARGHALDRALGFVIGSFALTGFTTVPLAGALADNLSWRAGFGLAVMIALSGIIATRLTLPEVEVHTTKHPGIREQVRMIAALPGLPAGLIGALFRFAMYASVVNYTAAYFVDDFGLAVSRAGLFFSIGSLGFLAASIASGFLLARLGGARALLGGGLAVGVLAATGFSGAISMALAGVSLFSVAAMMGILENASTSLLLRLAPDHRGAAMSLNELMAAGGSLFGIGVGALAIRVAGYAGIGTIIAISAVCAVISTWIALRVDRTARSMGWADASGGT